MTTSRLRPGSGKCAAMLRYEGRVRRVDWSLMPAGEDLLPVFYALMLWGTRHERP